MTNLNTLNSMKIALFVSSLNGGGVERVMLNLAKGLVDKKLEVDLVVAKAEGAYLNQIPTQVRLVDLNASRVLKSIPALVKYLKAEQPKVLLSAMDYANIIAVWAKYLSGVSTKVIVSEHWKPCDTRLSSTTKKRDLEQKIMPYLMRYSYPWADDVVSVSQGIADELVQNIRVPRKNITVIYNPAVSPENLKKASEVLNHPWLIPNQPPIILGVGRLHRTKNFASLIHAFALIKKQRQARLLILGEGEERLYLENIVKELELEEYVQMPGFVENPFAYMKSAAVFVLSSALEGLPTVLIEAMSVGTPVVSTDCPYGPAEILENGRYGKLVPLNNIEALASGIMEVLDNPPDNQKLMERTQAFKLEDVTDKYLNLFFN
jgi:glycosyltransferase involved in cell wall biosynthesis